MSLSQNLERPRTYFSVEPYQFHDREVISRPVRDGISTRMYFRVTLPPLDEINGVKEFKRIEFTMNWPTVNKSITQKNTECPISLEVIKKGKQYCTCKQCSYNFSKEEIKTHFKTQNKNNHDITCPMCRAKWSDKTIYINKANF